MLDAVQAWLRDLDFPIDSYSLDGRWHRFSRGGKKDKNCYFIGSYITLESGKEIAIATVGDFSTDEKYVFKPGIEFSEEEKKTFKEEKKKLRQKVKAQEQAIQKKARQQAIETLSKLPHAISTEYLRKKKIDPKDVHEIKGTSDYTLVPVIDEKNETLGFQRIGPDGTKRFKGGTKKAGTFFPIPSFASLQPAKTILIAEGFATAYSCWKSTGIPCVAGWDAGNLPEVGKILRRKFPGKKLVFCADNDRWTETGNVGINKAEEAARAIGASVCWPDFENLDDNPTDFNDLFVREGSDAVKRIIEAHFDVSGREAITCLGWNSEGYYYTSQENKDVVKVPISHTSSHLIHLMPLQYWKKAGYQTKRGMDWTRAASDLMEINRKVGIFNPKRIRGVGCWIDKQKLVIHLGDRLYTEGKILALRDIDSSNIYQLREDQAEPHKEPLTAREGKRLIEACDSLGWQHAFMGKLLAGYFATFRISGALDWRPHCWITGPAGSGKTTVMKLLADNLAGNAALRAFGNSTEAGIRQHIKYDAVPVLMDEAEAKGNDRRIRSVVDLARLSSAQSQAKSLKGTPEGKGQEYHCNSSFFLCSIQYALEDEADQSRFLLLRLGRNRKKWRDVEDKVDHITYEYGERLFSRMISRFTELQATIKTFKGVLGEAKTERFAQQYAPVLAGRWILENDEPVAPERAGPIALELLAEIETAGTERVEPDEQECLNHLLAYSIRVEIPQIRLDLPKPAPEEMLMRELISRVNREEISAEPLYKYGIGLKEGRIYISSNNPQLSKIYQGTKWEGRWSGSLVNLEGAISGKRRFIPLQKPLWHVSLPINLALPEQE